MDEKFLRPEELHDLKGDSTKLKNSHRVGTNIFF